MDDTVTLVEEDIKGWKDQMHSFTRAVRALWNAVLGSTTSQPKVAEFDIAVQTLRLAAEPGEDYAKVAARIQREALLYRNFLHHSPPIGKISLRVKEFHAHSGNYASTKQQLEVLEPAEGQCDPSEGRVSVCYTYGRSANRVLEFIVHDEKDKPLFAIARTYSNWIGSKEFNLGKNRKFYLDMNEEAPGYVMVYAGFKPSPRRDFVTVGQRLHPTQPVTESYRLDDPDPKPKQRRWWPPMQERLGYAGTFRTVMISLISGSLILLGATKLWPETPSPETKAVTATVDKPADVVFIAGPTANAVSGNELISGSAGESKSEIRPASIRTAQQTKRFAEVKALRISVDGASCKTTGDRCFELLSNVQKGVDSRLRKFSLPIINGNDKASIEPATLIVSFNAIDSLHGQIYLTLHDAQGTLWKNNGDLTYSNLTEPTTVAAYCDEVSSEIVWEITRAKSHLNPTADAKPSATMNSE